MPEILGRRGDLKVRPPSACYHRGILFVSAAQIGLEDLQIDKYRTFEIQHVPTGTFTYPQQQRFFLASISTFLYLSPSFSFSRISYAPDSLDVSTLDIVPS